jgi:hypothetical protein
MTVAQVLLAVAVGILTGLLLTGLRVAWCLWTTRINTVGDYAVAAIFWWLDRRDRRRSS